MNTEDNTRKDENRDPITGEPGSHPLGTGLGSASGAAAGAAIGALGGPVGMAVGGVIGAVAGGVVGHEVAEGLDPTAEDAYWNEQHRKEPYYEADYDFNDYRPAYRMGYDQYARNPGVSFDSTEASLSDKWNDEYRGRSRLEWEKARDAMRAGWERLENRQSPSSRPDHKP